MLKNSYPGKFITIDGIDGSGKSTQLKFIASWFKDRNYDVYTGHEPSSQEAGIKARNIIEGKEPTPDDLMEFQKIFIKDRKEHLMSEIIPILKKENSVYICDRYFLSTLAYGMAQGLNFDDLMLEHKNILGDTFILPDLMFIMDIPADIAFMRLKNRKSGESLEYFEKKEDFLKKTANAFKAMEDKFENMYFIPSNSSMSEVSDEFEKVLIKFFK